MDKLLLSAKGTLALLDLLSSTEPTSNNVWNKQAHRLRAAIDKIEGELKGSTFATDTTEPTHTAQPAV